MSPRLFCPPRQKRNHFLIMSFNNNSSQLFILWIVFLTPNPPKNRQKEGCLTSEDIWYQLGAIRSRLKPVCVENSRTTFRQNHLQTNRQTQMFQQIYSKRKQMMKAAVKNFMKNKVKSTILCNKNSHPSRYDVTEGTGSRGSPRPPSVQQTG